MFKGVLAFVIFSGALWAQSDTASLSGTVTDPSGAGVVDAEVTLRNIATFSRRVTLTDIQGLYHCSALVPGQYELTVMAKGFAKHQDTQFSLLVAQAGRLDVELRAGSITETIVVETNISMLNADSVSQGTVIGHEK